MEGINGVKGEEGFIGNHSFQVRRSSWRSFTVGLEYPGVGGRVLVGGRARNSSGWQVRKGAVP